MARRTFSFLLLLGCTLVLLPFAVMLLEWILAILAGATGERLAAAGFWGVFIGFYTFVPGLVMLAIALLFRRRK